MTEIQDRLQKTLGDRYEFERELGRGGMATVYLARDLKHDREVAVKVLHPDLAASIGGERFGREIKLAAKLQHPHILGLYDSGEADGLLYYVMPFVKGESLRDRLDREGQLPIDDAVQVALEVAGALGHAHEAGIVHRDIKPENVLISGGHALVADFGIARAATEGGGQKLTQTGMALGTPVYMAPEQAAGEVVGPTADLYSLGCMLYEMLSGEPPFTGANAMSIMAKHAMEMVPSIRIVRSSVPEEVEETILAAMEKTPADRPQTAAKFAEMLGLPPGSTSSYRVAMRQTATRRVPSGATAAFRAQQAQPLWKKPWVLGAAAVVLVGGGFGVWKLAAGGSAPAPVGGGLDPRNVAVLYFEDLSRDQDLGPVADGLTEDLIARLSEVPAIAVVSKNGVASVRGVSALDSVAKVLNTGTLVRGEVRRAGEDIVVNVSLVDGNSGAEWGKRATIELPAAALLAARDSVAGQVKDLISQQLGQELRLQLRRQSTSSVEAWSHVQQAEVLRKRGEAAFAKGDTTSGTQAFAAADSVLQLARGEDPRWEQPSILRGLLAYRRSRVSGGDPRNATWIELGLSHLDSAFAIDSNNADARELKGNLEYWKYLLGIEGNSEKAIQLLMGAKRDLEEATKINRLQAGAWASLSHLYYRTSELTDVNIAASNAYNADAFLENASTILTRLFLSDFDLKNLSKAEEWCEQLLIRFPESAAPFDCELRLQASPAPKHLQPDIQLAWRYVDSVTKYTPDALKEKIRRQSSVLVAIALARAGLADSARSVVERSQADRDLDPGRDIALLSAWAYCQLGDLASAVEMFKVYFVANPSVRRNYRENPGWMFKGLEDYPDFRALVGGP